MVLLKLKVDHCFEFACYIVDYIKKSIYILSLNKYVKEHICYGIYDAAVCMGNLVYVLDIVVFRQDHQWWSYYQKAVSESW